MNTKKYSSILIVLSIVLVLVVVLPLISNLYIRGIIDWSGSLLSLF